LIIDGNNPYTEPSFSLRNRAQRVIWGVVYAILFKPSIRPMHQWRAFLLRLFGARIGINVHIYPTVKIWAPWNLTVGDNVGIGDGVTLYDMDKIVIGDYCVISQGAHLCGGAHDYNSKNFQLYARPILIGEYAWICTEAFISLGVSIPDGCVVGARAVVTKTLEDSWTVYAGSPCKKIKKRKRIDRYEAAGISVNSNEERIE
jgi:putative colanic acid biosynthesis acetyltransferase WcaF